VAQYHAHLEAAAVVESVAGAWHTHAMGRLAGRRVIAVTGIARPEPFYALLHRWDATIEEVFEYPDHHRYTAEQWQRIARRGHDVDLIVTTEKDLVKLEAFPFATGKLVALRIAPRVQQGAALLDDIAARVGLPPPSAKETSDGHQ
jgi:tetraacyldisaccharide 4'-kinase